MATALVSACVSFEESQVPMADLQLETLRWASARITAFVSVGLSSARLQDVQP
jgi:hypothetical protein